MTTQSRGANQQHERQFVGTVCASLSHDIKNCLAIINENAGLLGDLALMAGQGRPVDPERQGRIAAMIQKQVKRSDALVGQLNRFAHSGDVDCRSLELGETIRFVMALFERTAAKAGARIEAGSLGEVTMETAPLQLMQLLWGLLAEGVGRAAGGRLVVGAEAANQEALIRIEVQPPPVDAQLSAQPPSPLPEAVLDLARAMGGILEQIPDGGAFKLALPLKGVPHCPEGP